MSSGDRGTGVNAATLDGAEPAYISAQAGVWPVLRGAIYGVFFLSGAAALAYEISWARQIGLLFGHTAAAAATVLASYFAGLAVGYWVGGRMADRLKRPLAVYGWMEIAAGGWAILIPSLMGMLNWPLLASVIHQPNSAWQPIVRAAACLLLLLPATTALGATLPLMARWLEAGGDRGTSRVAWAYGLNTLGGLVGVLAATWFLLSAVGVAASSFLAAGVSVLCGLVAIAAGCFAPGEVSKSREHDDQPPLHDASSGTFSIALTALVAASGFATLALEVLYTRLFALVFHNSTYTFGLVVAVVLLALAVGAWLAALAPRRVPPLHLAGWMSLVAAGAVSLSTLIFLRQTGVDYFRGGETFTAYMLAGLSLVALIVAPPAVLLGTVLPLLWSAAALREGEAPAEPGEESESRPGRSHALGRRASVSRIVGRLTAANTLSAAAGALAASFVLLPLIGLWASFAGIAFFCLVNGIAMFALQGRMTPFHAAGIVIAGCLAIAAWQTTAAKTSAPRGESIVYRSESAYGWIDVVKDDESGELNLRENVNYTHGSTASGEWERRQAHIPLLLHPKPSDVLFLGCGTGATAGGATMHDGVESITIVELIPQVIDAARLFDESNFGVFDDPRTRVEIDDARHYLLVTDRKFDVIVSDLFVPWESKTGYLYTVDHYRAARGRMAPGGIFCQWLPMWQLGEREFTMIADSFAAVFPYTTVWLGKGSDHHTIIGLVGSEAPLRVDGGDVGRRLEQFFADAKAVDMRLNEPRDLSRRFIGRWPAMSNGATLNTDEHPRLEFAMPLTYADRRTLKQRQMQQFHEDVLKLLPQAGVAFGKFEEGDTAPPARHQWQQLQLRK